MTRALTTTKRKISFYTSKKQSATNLQRKAETRSKIQLGGLLIKSGLAEVFSISPGADLQLDEQEKEKATLLLGALIDLKKNISSHAHSPSQREEWAILGRAAFMDHFLSLK